MSVDRNGRSHRPAGLPKGYAGTYDGNDAGSDAFDIQPPDPAILKRMGSHVPDPVADAHTGRTRPACPSTATTGA